MKKTKRIFIIGVSGSGKTWLAEKLSNKLKIKKYNLDDIEWIKKYNKRRDYKNKIKKLNEIVKDKKWIIEGVYTHWTENAVKKADIIIWIKPKSKKLIFRLIKRFISDKIKGRNKKIKDLKNLIKFAKNYNLYKEKNEAYKNHKILVEKNKKNLIILKNNKETKSFLRKIK